MGNSESSAPTSSENLVSEVSAGVESTSLNSNSLSQDHDIESLTEKIRELESMHSDALAVLGTSRDELAELIKQTEEKLSTNELEHRAQIQHLEETLGAKHKERKAALIAQKSAELNCDLDEVRGVALVERSVMFKEDLRSQAIGDLNRRWKIMEGELKAQFSRDYEQACRFSRDEHQKVFDNRTAPLLERIKELDEQVRQKQKKRSSGIFGWLTGKRGKFESVDESFSGEDSDSSGDGDEEYQDASDEFSSRQQLPHTIAIVEGYRQDNHADV